MKKYATIRNYARLHHKQVGMTLIELTVVLLILVGLAGLLIPYVGSFVQKTHDSTSSSNLSQLNNAMMRFGVEKNRLPHHMETLTNFTTATGTGAACAGSQTAGNAYCGLLDAAMFTPVDYAAAATAPTSHTVAIDSLHKAGLSMFVSNKADTANKTFDSVANMSMSYLPGYAVMDGGVVGQEHGNFVKVAPRPSVAGDTVPAHLSAALGGAPMDYSTTCYDYVALGIGDKNELIGNTMTSAPVHFPENAEKGPVQYYNHYLAIFQVDKDNTSAACSEVTEKAKFLGTVMNTPAYPGSLLNGVGASLSYTYTNQAAEGK